MLSMLLCGIATPLREFVVVGYWSNAGSLRIRESRFKFSTHHLFQEFSAQVSFTRLEEWYGKGVGLSADLCGNLLLA